MDEPASERLPAPVLFGDRLVAGLLLALCGYLVVRKLSRALADGGAAAAEQAPVVGGAAAIAAIALVLCAGLACAAAFGRRLVGHLREGLARPPRPGLTIALALVAYGATRLVVVAALLSLPPATLRIRESPDGPREVPVPHAGLRFGPRGLGGGAVEVPELGAVRATLEATFEEARLRVEAGTASAAPVLVDGRLVNGETVVLAPGAVLRVGSVVADLAPVSRATLFGRVLLGQAAATFGIVLLVGLAGGGRALAALGVARAGAARDALWGVVACLAALPAYALVVLANVGVCTLLGVPLESHALVRELQREGPGLLLVVVVQAVVVAPLNEELVCRGLLYPGLRHVLPPAAAIAATAFVFAAMHESEGVSSVLPLSFLGALFTSVYVASPGRTLAGAVAAHAVFNGLTLLVVSLALA